MPLAQRLLKWKALLGKHKRAVEHLARERNRWSDLASGWVDFAALPMRTGAVHAPFDADDSMTPKGLFARRSNQRGRPEGRLCGGQCCRSPPHPPGQAILDNQCQFRVTADGTNVLGIPEKSKDSQVRLITQPRKHGSGHSRLGRSSHGCGMIAVGQGPRHIRRHSQGWGYCSRCRLPGRRESSPAARQNDARGPVRRQGSLSSSSCQRWRARRIRGFARGRSFPRRFRRAGRSRSIQWDSGAPNLTRSRWQDSKGAVRVGS